MATYSPQQLGITAPSGKKSSPAFKLIPLTKGKFAMVDSADFNWLSKWKWYFCHGYAYHSFKELGWKVIAMHQLIAKTPNGYETDHINRNKLDNRRCNLRVVTTSQNQHNTVESIKNTSGYKGVTYHKRDRYWQASIRKDGTRFYLGSFKNIEDARKVYELASRGII